MEFHNSWEKVENRRQRIFHAFVFLVNIITSDIEQTYTELTRENTCGWLHKWQPKVSSEMGAAAHALSIYRSF